MKYLWFGLCLSPSDKEKIIANGGKLLSGEVANNTLLKGLEENGIICDTINTYNLPTYPAYPQKKIEGYSWNRVAQSQDYTIGYKNIKYFNILSKTKNIVKASKQWARKHKDEEVTIFVYQMHSPFMAGACAVKKIIPSAKIVLIVPDLPQYMDLRTSIIKRFLKKIDWIGIKRRMKRVDKYVLYSKHMADFLHLKKNDWIVMEGAFNPSLLIEENISKEEDKTSIMYSGVLDMRYGIPELLDAMPLLDERYELWLTGHGNAIPLIEERAKNDERIKFFGFLPSRRDLLLKQKEASMLISPRHTNEEASKYCFPSKLFEYMISGNPVLSTNIAGIPEEYDSYLIKIEATNAESIASAIKQVADMKKQEREEFGFRAKRFILEEKNAQAQTRKILEFIK